MNLLKPYGHIAPQFSWINNIQESITSWETVLVAVIIAVVSTALNFAVTAIIGAISGKPKSPQIPPYQTYETIQATEEPQHFSYGRVRCPGILTFAGHAGAGNSQLWLVLTWMAHQCDSIEGYYVNNEWNVSGSDFYNYITMYGHLGANPQTVDTNLQSAIPQWDESHQGNGICYSVSYLSFNIIFSGIPSISAVLRGKQVYDPRTSTTAWSNNSALCVRDYLTNYMGIPTSQIDDTTFSAAADICDEMVQCLSVSAPPVSAPIVSETSGGTLGSRTYYVNVTYTMSDGETIASPQASITVDANNVLVVNSPPSVTGATGWFPYVGLIATSSTTNGDAERQTGPTPIAIGTNWTEPDTGRIYGLMMPMPVNVQTNQVTTTNIQTGVSTTISCPGQIGLPTNAVTLAGGSVVPASMVVEDMDQVYLLGSPPAPLSTGTPYYFRSSGPCMGYLCTTLANARSNVVISLPGGVTNFQIVRTAQPRYTCDGFWLSSTDRINILQNLMSSMAGDLIWQQGTYKIYAGAYISPVWSFNENSLRGQVQVRVKQSRQTLFNSIRATFLEPLKLWQNDITPEITSATFLAEDNGHKLQKDIQLLYTVGMLRAQRLATMHLQRSRNQMTVTAQMNWSALPVCVRDNVQFSLAELGFTSKEFTVLNWTITTTGGIDLTLQEEDAAAYVWDSLGALAPDPQPQGQLANGLVVTAPTNLSLASGNDYITIQGDGTVFAQLLVSWTQPEDTFVINGGSIDVQYQKTGSSIWIDNGAVPGSSTQTIIYGLQNDTAWNVRIRSVNVIGNTSPWVEVDNYTLVGKTLLPSNVPSIDVEQNGLAVILTGGPIPDFDVAAYEFRYGANANWDSMTVIEDATARPNTDCSFTTGMVVFGTWYFAVKAKDTSGNYSSTPTFIQKTISNVSSYSYANAAGQPDWLNLGVGTGTGFIEHWTGVLVPNGTSDWSSYSTWASLPNFNPDPVTTAIYEFPTIDITFNSTAVVSLTDSYYNIGGVSGSPNVVMELDTWLSGGSDSNTFSDWTTGSITARYIRARIVETPGGVPACISKFDEVAYQAGLTEYSFSGLTIASGGTTVTFPTSTPFHSIPNVSCIPTGANIGWVTSPSTTQATLHMGPDTLHDNGGTGGYIAKGV